MTIHICRAGLLAASLALGCDPGDEPIAPTSRLQPVLAPGRTAGAWLDWTSLRHAGNEAEARQAADELVDRAARAGLNTIYAIAFRYGCAMLTQVDDPPGITVPRCNPAIDYYGVVLEAARARAPAMEVVPWIERPLAVGSHEPVFAAVKKLYQAQGLLEPPQIHYSEGGYTFPMIDSADPRVRAVLVAVTDSLVKRYGARRIQFDDHIRLPAAQRHNSALEKKVIGLGHHWFSTIRQRHPGVLIELAPLVLSYSIGAYGTDWTRWSSLIDRLYIQCYKMTAQQMLADGQCHTAPTSMAGKLYGIGLYFKMWGKWIDDGELLAMVEHQLQRKQSFVLFTLERLPERLVGKLRVSLTGAPALAGKATARRNGSLDGAYIRRAPSQLAQLQQGDLCKVAPNHTLAFYEGEPYGNFLGVEITIPPSDCPGHTGRWFIYKPSFNIISSIMSE
jgi:uncharacterized lipoprotein YddW (UPF0748 family)